MSVVRVAWQGLPPLSGVITHLQLVITPDKGGKPCQATLTTLILR